MRFLLILLLMTILGFGCASMQVGGTKEPIKVDISMRLDIYQHIEKDIDAIESIVSGAPAQGNEQTTDDQSLLGIFCRSAYAQGGLSPEVEQAALSRRGRLAELSSWQSQGIVGENRKGLVEIRVAQSAEPSLNQIIVAENSDRMIIYQAVADKNGTSVAEVQKLYAKRLQADAPAGTPVEAWDEASGAYQWQVK